MYPAWGFMFGVFPPGRLFHHSLCAAFFIFQASAPRRCSWRNFPDLSVSRVLFLFLLPPWYISFLVPGIACKDPFYPCSAHGYVPSSSLFLCLQHKIECRFPRSWILNCLVQHLTYICRIICPASYQLEVTAFNSHRFYPDFLGGRSWED